MVNGLESRTDIQRDLDRLKEWADGNTFSKSKYKVTHLRWSNPCNSTGWRQWPGKQLHGKGSGGPSGQQVEH